MENLEKLIEKAYYNGNKITTEDISALNINEDEYDKLLIALKHKNIEVIEEKILQYNLSSDNYVCDDVQAYLREITRIPLLNAEEEKELAYKIYNDLDEEARKK